MRRREEGVFVSGSLGIKFFGNRVDVLANRVCGWSTHGWLAEGGEGGPGEGGSAL